MLKLVNLEKSYKDQKILKGINVDLSNPGLYIINGINGSGKSTMLKIISGIVYKTDGELEKDISISYLPDKFTFPKLMNVKRYVMELLDDKSKVKALELLNRYQIPIKKIGDLSKGNLQKLGLLQIFLNDKDCYILDEPLDGLDDFSKKLFKELIKEKLELNKIVILSLHGKITYSDLKPRVFDIKMGELHERKRKTKEE